MPRCSPRGSPAFTLASVPPLTSRCGSGGAEPEYRSRRRRIPRPNRRDAYIRRTQPPPSPPPQGRLQNCQVRGHGEAVCSLFATQCVFRRLELPFPSGPEPRLSSPAPGRAEAPSSEEAARRQLPLPTALPRGFRNRRSLSRARCGPSDSRSLPSPGIKHALLTVPSLLGRRAAAHKWKGGGEECIN